MFNKKADNISTTLTETIIGKGTKIVGGTLTGLASLRVDGEFVGTIDIDGHLILGDTGSVDGDIRAKSAMVAGRANSGLIVCKDALHIVSTGTIHGDIQVGSLIVDEEAVFIGNCKMTRENMQAEVQLPKKDKQRDSLYKSNDDKLYSQIEIPY